MQELFKVFVWTDLIGWAGGHMSALWERLREMTQTTFSEPEESCGQRTGVCTWQLAALSRVQTHTCGCHSSEECPLPHLSQCARRVMASDMWSVCWAELMFNVFHEQLCVWAPPAVSSSLLHPLTPQSNSSPLFDRTEVGGQQHRGRQ